MVEGDFGEVGADVVGVAVVDIVPNLLHAADLRSVFVGELAEEGVFELLRGGARNHAGDVHLRVAGAGETEVDHANYFVVPIEEDVAEVEVAVNELVPLGALDVVVVCVDVGGVVLVVELVEEIGEGVLDFLGGLFEVDAAQLLDELGDIVSGAGEGGVTEVINAVAEGVAFDFLVDGEGAVVFVVVELHLGSVETSLAFDEVADGGVFFDHFGPEGVAREAEEIIAAVSGDFDDDVGPAGEDVLGFLDFFVGEGLGDDFVERVKGGKK